MKSRFITAFLALFLFMPSTLPSQQQVGNPNWGFSFSVPSGWLYQQTEEGVILGHNTIAGMILVLPHMASTIQEVRSEMQGGITDEGLELYLAGSLKALSKGILAGEYQGTFQFQQVRARCFGTLSPYGGAGAFIIAMTTPQQYGSALSGPADAIARSMQYQKMDGGNLAGHFSGTWVHYSKYGQTTVTLAANGDYYFHDESSYSGNLGDGTSNKGTWSIGGESRDRGRWTVRGNKQAGSLIITYQDGSRENIEYQVFVEKGQAYWSEYLFDGTHYRKE